MAAASSSQHRCVFVGNIPYDATEEQLIQICEEVGPVVSFRLVIDRETGKPKGYGFCEYKDEETALSARRNLQGYEINGRQLRVDFAENDKGTVNREQGRGGPGFTSTNDSNAQKLLPRPPNPGDSSFHQPVGHPLAVTTASAMARTLGGPQTSGLPLMQNGLQNHSGVGNDPLSQYLGKMSRQQLNEIMSEMKTLAVQNKALAQQLLQGCPQLPKALFQAQIMLGMVTPQMMQMANSGQSSSSVQRLAIQNSMPNQNPLLPSHPGQTLSQKGSLVGPLVRPPESQVSSALQNPSVLQQLSIPVQPPFQHHLPPKPKTFLQGTLPDKYGITTEPQNISSLSNQPQIQPLPTSNNLISQVKPPVLQHPKPPGDAVVGHHPQPFIPDSQRQSYLPYPMTSQSGPANYPVLANGLNSLSKEAGAYASTGHDSAWVSTGSIQSTSGVGLTAKTRTSERSEMMNPRPKRPKLEDGSGAHLPVTNTLSTSSSFTAPSIVIGSVLGSQIANADVLQHSEKQMPQLPAEVESALLQQVMNLTPEQLSSLPLEQQQQVLQLQQMLVKQNL